MKSANFDIIMVETKAQLKAFIDLPYMLYKNDPQWRAPLRFERKTHLSFEKNPTALADRMFFLAQKDGDYIGRIAGFLNPVHEEIQKDGAGFFGFFDCVADPDIGAALLEAAQNWLVGRGVKKIIGPSNWGVNDECGLLIDGFDTPPAVMMPHGRADYQNMVEGAGFKKATDLFAYDCDLLGGYPRRGAVKKLIDMSINEPRFEMRQLNVKNFKSEMAMVMDIFNDAWADNWGFIPFSDAQIAHMTKELRPLIIPKCFWIGYVNGEPVGFTMMIPDLNVATQGLDGRLFPLGWAKLLTRLKITGVKRARLPLMGIRRSVQKSRDGIAIAIGLCEKLYGSARDYGFTHAELSWILEDNKSMISIIKACEAKKYKTYRMYEKEL